MNYYHQLLDWLKQEKEEDLKEYIRQVRQRPLNERVQQGYAWHPLKVLNTGFALGDKAFVVVERTTRLNEPHQIRAGAAVNFCTQTPHVHQPERAGVVNYVDRNRMKITLNSRDVPDWLNMGQLSIDLLFDDRTYAEMERAMHAMLIAKGNRLAELRQRLLPSEKHKFATVQYAPLDHSHPPEDNENGLNSSQTAAIQAIQANQDICIVHGPPGTGKTTTLVAAIQALVQTEQTVLVTAPSNTAADLLTERLAAKGVQVVRIGNISRIDNGVLPYTLDAILARHPETKNIRKVKLEAAEMRRQAQRFRRSFGAEERQERNHLNTQSRELEDWARTLEDRLVDQVLNGAQAITCTLVGAAHPVLDKRRFRTCVIDEAAQALEPACWIPMTKCSRVVLAGDPFQLPPTVKSVQAAKLGLTNTLIERAIGLLPDQVHLLDTQYRMHRSIMGFSNQYFYQGALKAANAVGERRLMTLDAESDTLTVFDPLVFVDTAGCGFDEKLGQKSNESRAASRFNPEEGLLLREHLLQLIRTFPKNQPLPGIGILSPYREQVNYLDELLREDPEIGALVKSNVHTPLDVDSELANQESANTIVINTIDGFQGQERDIIYLSLVRSNAKNEIGFLSDYRRMNVAMTRARMLLVLIGDSATIGKNKFYESLLIYCEREGKYQTAWEYMR
jgi:ATP-dependent RNA/DNA helicase IGHMBP2